MKHRYFLWFMETLVINSFLYVNIFSQLRQILRKLQVLFSENRYDFLTLDRALQRLAYDVKI